MVSRAPVVIAPVEDRFREYGRPRCRNEACTNRGYAVKRFYVRVGATSKFNPAGYICPVCRSVSVDPGAELG